MFGKQKTTKTAEEILSLIETLPEEEQEKLRAALTEDEGDAATQDGNDVPVEETAEKTDGEGEDDPVTKAKQTGAPSQEPSKEAQEASEAEAEADGDDAEGEEENADALQAITARLRALEDKFAAFLAERQQEGEGDFGMSPTSEVPAEAEDRSSAIMRGYAGKNAYKYQ